MTRCPLCGCKLIATRWLRIEDAEVHVVPTSVGSYLAVKDCCLDDYDLDDPDETTIVCKNGHGEDEMVEKLKEGEAHVDREMSSV